MSRRQNPKYFSDDDLESSQRTPFLNEKVVKNSNYRGSVFKLIQATQKMWKLWNDISYGICQEPTAFVVKNKPIFDDEKLGLISIAAFAERDLTSGKAGSFKSRHIYSGRFLNSETFSNDWNKLAMETNKIIQSINNDIYRESVWNGVIGTSKIEKSQYAFKFSNMCIIITVICGILFVMVTMIVFVNHMQYADTRSSYTIPVDLQSPVSPQDNKWPNKIPTGVQSLFEVSKLLATDGCFQPCKRDTLVRFGTPTAADWILAACGDMQPGSAIFIGSYLNNNISLFAVGAFASFDIFERARIKTRQQFIAFSDSSFYVEENDAYWYNVVIVDLQKSVFGFSKYPPTLTASSNSFIDNNCANDHVRCGKSLSIGSTLCSSCTGCLVSNYAIYKSTCEIVLQY